MIVLAIETSCDETAVGIVDSDLRVLANELYSQIPEHAPYGGVVPEIAARTHFDRLAEMLELALEKSGLTLRQIDAIAFTRGPGLNGPLLVGAAFARGLAMNLGLPCYGVHHLEGHIAAAHLSFPELSPPYVCLTVSGGHTELTLVEKGFKFTSLGRTRDDAAGEAFDKSGKILGLGYPAGATIGRLGAQGNRKFHRFPRSYLDKNTGEFSFSGLKTAVLRYVEEHGKPWIEEHMPDVCASLEAAIVDILVDKSKWALERCGLDQIVVCGGVSANRALRDKFAEQQKRGKLRAYFPNFEYCTDNGAMIAGACQLRLNAGLADSMGEVQVRPSWPLG